MQTVINNNVTHFLTNDTQQKLIIVADQLKQSPNDLLNTLLDDEIERQRLLECSKNLPKRKAKIAVPSQKIINLCNKHLSMLNDESEIVDIMTSIENLYNELLKCNLLSINSRENHIVESDRIKTSKVDYYWYTSNLAKNIGICFGVMDIYLFHELFHPNSEILFIGMPNNVAICSQIYSQLYKILKKIKLRYKKIAGKWGSNREMEEAANRYMCDFSYKLQNTQAYIEDDCSEYICNYAIKKYSWALR